jgi:predicted RNase H-like HicB family nuclease
MSENIAHRIFQYTAIFEPDEDAGGFTVTVPALSGCVSEGDTFEEALANIKEAMALYIESLAKDNLPIPEEREPTHYAVDCRV